MISVELFLNKLEILDIWTLKKKNKCMFLFRVVENLQVKAYLAILANMITTH